MGWLQQDRADAVGDATEPTQFFGRPVPAGIDGIRVGRLNGSPGTAQSCRELVQRAYRPPGQKDPTSTCNDLAGNRRTNPTSPTNDEYLLHGRLVLFVCWSPAGY